MRWRQHNAPVFTYTNCFKTIRPIFFFWHYSSCWRLASFQNFSACPILETSPQNIFTGWGSQALAQIPTWWTRVTHFLWTITFGLSGMWGPTGSCATCSLALIFISPRKPHHGRILWDLLRKPCYCATCLKGNLGITRSSFSGKV